MAELRFYYDIVCPYAYLASMQVEALAARVGAELQWRPVLLGGLFRAASAPSPRRRDEPASRPLQPARPPALGRPLGRPAHLPGCAPAPHRRGHAPAHRRRPPAEARRASAARSSAPTGPTDSTSATAPSSPSSPAASASILTLWTARPPATASSPAPPRPPSSAPSACRPSPSAIASGGGQDRLHFVEAALGGQPPRPGDRPIDPRGARRDRSLLRLLQPLRLPRRHPDRADRRRPPRPRVLAADPPRRPLPRARHP
ncbi:MAG: DsbA family protein [Nannocystis sp.]|nr:DsbA family protein [Nannocystis sp.]